MAFAAHGIPSTEWDTGWIDPTGATVTTMEGKPVFLGIPPIHPAEWLTDAGAAR